MSNLDFHSVSNRSGHRTGRLHLSSVCLALLTCGVLVACGSTSTSVPVSSSGTTTISPAATYSVSGTVTLPGATASSLTLSAATPDWTAPHVSGQVLITGGSSTALSTQNLNTQSISGTALRLATTPGGQTDQAYAEKLIAAGVQAQPNYLYKALSIPNDPGYPGNAGLTVDGSASTQTYLDRIDAASGWAALQAAGVPLTGAEVAVLDTGVDFKHPDLAGRLLTGYDFGDGDADASEDATTTAGHGTNTTGLIGAVGNNGVGIAGLTWTGQTLLPVKVFSGENATTSALASGISYAVKQGAKVINMSLGVTGVNTDTALATAIQSAASADVLLVAAAGNTPDDGLYYPASDSNVVAVGALGDSDSLACYSARPASGQKALDLVAPGGNAGSGTKSCYSFTGSQVLTLTTVANGSYALDAGTSEAAPLVSGAAALLRAERSDLSAAQVKAILVASAKSVAGGSLLDVGAAVMLAKSYAAVASRSYTLKVQAQQSGQTVQAFSGSGTLTGGQSSLPFSIAGLPAGTYTLVTTLTVNGTSYTGSQVLTLTQDQSGVVLQTQ